MRGRRDAGATRLEDVHQRPVLQPRVPPPKSWLEAPLRFADEAAEFATDVNPASIIVPHSGGSSAIEVLDPARGSNVWLRAISERRNIARARSGGGVRPWSHCAIVYLIGTIAACAPAINVRDAAFCACPTAVSRKKRSRMGGSIPSRGHDLNVNSEPGEGAGERVLEGGDESIGIIVDCRLDRCFEDWLQRCGIFFRIENRHGTFYDLANFTAACVIWCTR